MASERKSPQFAPYFWIITEAFAIEELPPDSECVGICGPSNGDETLKINNINPADFELYDDDNTLCFAGKIYGAYEGMEPLDDWGKGGYGCTGIKLNGEWV